jgi:hypothetical protein
LNIEVAIIATPQMPVAKDATCFDELKTSFDVRVREIKP